MSNPPPYNVPGPIGAGSRITAVLGPTNTGKTHLAIERMLAHQSGMIGLPLRLLAREVYDKVVARVGAGAVALITGEEKIMPASPRYYVSTVEAMPHSVPVDFLAIDEIQLASDPDRGHVFTRRLLQARGTSETMVLGAATMRLAIERLLPGTNFISRPRFSALTYAGSKKITRLAPRSVIVAFSVDAVYAIAELIRRQRGGAAVVLGALSPRTRNAQVALYQAGEVEFLIATDAIGMGLNMDIDHVAFSGVRKFDGAQNRDLTAAELAQIAGRAGRHMNDGTFGVTGECQQLDEQTVQRIEAHRFDSVQALYWRNNDLDYATPTSLIASLTLAPVLANLVRGGQSSDQQTLEYLLSRGELADISGPAAVKQLWETCQIPDYRKLGASEHAALVLRIYRSLMSDEGTINEDWLAEQVSQSDRTDGDIDTLATRISHIRTWTFVANKGHWLGDAEHWRDKTRAVEDRLSDALHERLTKRFIDRRTSVLMKKLKDKQHIETDITDTGDIVAEGEYIGKIDGLQFVADQGARQGADAKALRGAAQRILAGELSGRVKRLAGEPDLAFATTESGYLTWRGTPVARLEGGETALRPRLKLLADDAIQATDAQTATDHLQAWLETHIKTVLEPLFALDADPEITGLARGVGFRLVENLGLVPRQEVAGDVKQLDQPSRATMRRHGLRFGAFSLYFPALLKPQAAFLRVLLYKLAQEAGTQTLRDDWPKPPTAGLTSLSVGADAPVGFYQALGYRICGTRAVRVDMLERLSDTIRPLIHWKATEEKSQRPEGSHISGGFTVTAGMMSLVGCSGDDFAGILKSLGFRLSRVEAPKSLIDMAPSGLSGDQTEPLETVAKDAAEPVAPTEPAVPAEPVAPAEPAVPAESEAPAEPAAPAESAAPAEPAEPAAPAEPAPDPIPAPASPPEPVMIDVWRPRRAERHARTSGATRRGAHQPDATGKDTGEQRRPRHAKRPANSGAKGNRHQGHRPDAGKGNSRAPAKKSASPARQKPVDLKNSPFAALLALKEKMAQDQDN